MKTDCEWSDGCPFEGREREEGGAMREASSKKAHASSSSSSFNEATHYYPKRKVPFLFLYLIVVLASIPLRQSCSKIWIWHLAELNVKWVVGHGFTRVPPATRRTLPRLFDVRQLLPKCRLTRSWLTPDCSWKFNYIIFCSSFQLNTTLLLFVTTVYPR